MRISSRSDAVTAQSLGRRAAALVECGDEPLPRFDLVKHGGVGGRHRISGCLHTYVTARIATPRAGCNGGENSRSEEHTSELQSLMRISYAVFCLKKKNKQNINKKRTIVRTPNMYTKKHSHILQR